MVEKYPLMILERPTTGSRLKVPFADISDEIANVISDWLMKGEQPNEYVEEWMQIQILAWLGDTYPDWRYITCQAFAR